MISHVSHMIIEEFDDEEENDARISRSLHDPNLG